MDPDSVEVGAGAPPELARTAYDTLRAIAQRQMRGERVEHTLTATALVHEAYVKLAGGGSTALPPEHFYGVAAQAMRRILLDHARRRKADKRWAGGRRVSDLENVVDLAMHGDPEDILTLDEAIQHLEREDARAASVVRLRFYAGLSGDEVAKVVGISPRQVDREWAYARTFLFKLLGSPPDDA